VASDDLLTHDHDHPHAHGHDHSHGHGHGGHTHGLVHESIKRSREGLRAVGLALLILGATAILQLLVFLASGSVALLADLIHNFGDAATAIPLAIAFALRSARAERWPASPWSSRSSPAPVSPATRRSTGC